MNFKDLINLFSIGSIKQVNHYIISVASNMAFNLLLIIFLTRFVSTENYGHNSFIQNFFTNNNFSWGIGLSQSAVH